MSVLPARVTEKTQLFTRRANGSTALALVALCAMGAFEGCSNSPIVDGSIIVGTRESDGTITPYTNNGEVPLVWGFQGGTMITPSISIDGALGTGDEVPFDVSVENFDAATNQPWPNYSGFSQRTMTFSRVGNRLVSAPIQDQLAFEDLPGARMKLRVTVATPRGNLQHEVSFTLRSAGPRRRGACALSPMYCDDALSNLDDASARD
jgi:hypothetical protein